MSGIIAQSKVNFSNLPEIEEFNNHKNLVEVALVTAEDLHGRYLAALRNNEYDVAKSIVSAINLNKSTEIKAFENALEDFNNKSLNAYNNFDDLPWIIAQQPLFQSQMHLRILYILMQILNMQLYLSP